MSKAHFYFVLSVPAAMRPRTEDMHRTVGLLQKSDSESGHVGVYIIMVKDP